jgi:hypothetical protein
MTTVSTSPLEQVIRQAGEGWIIDYFEPKAEAMNHIRHVLDKVNKLGHERLGENAPDLSEAALVSEFQHHRSQLKGFFQALGGTRTPDMLLMAWRVMQGMRIKNVQLAYHLQESFQMRVILESEYGEDDESYESTNVNDFTLFRHIGIHEINGRPVLDGFYPLKVRESVS